MRENWSSGSNCGISSVVELAENFGLCAFLDPMFLENIDQLGVGRGLKKHYAESFSTRNFGVPLGDAGWTRAGFGQEGEEVGCCNRALSLRKALFFAAPSRAGKISLPMLGPFKSERHPETKAVFLMRD